MNSSFYFPNFEKFYKTAREAFPHFQDEDGPSRHAQHTVAPPNKLLEESGSEVASNFSSPVGVNSVPLPLNTVAA